MEEGHLRAVHAVARRVEIRMACCLLDGERNKYGYRGSPEGSNYLMLDGIQ
jgi:hypothetical protein